MLTRGRRGAPEILVALLLLVLLASYVAYTRQVVRDLRLEAERTSRMYARVFRALTDTTEGAGTLALLDLARSIREQRVPLVVASAEGHPTSHANLPGIDDDTPPDDPRVRAMMARLDRENPPVVEPGVGTVHYGNPPVVRWLRIIPALQAAFAGILLLAGFWILRARHDAARERLWAGMARESAHQLGTPLSSLSGWVELLEDEASPTVRRAVEHMRADLERLDRVAHRFERIGREPRRDPVELRSLVDRMAAYFRSRVPTLANAITIEVRHDADDMLEVRGDLVLLEWALEVLTKNAIDALAGRGGHITLATARTPKGARVVVADDGPGIPRELRDRIFEPGFSTKTKGWGIGLSLARRIVEESHEGRLALAHVDRGAAFEIML